MEGDISQKTIVVLVVLTVLISVLSTLVVLNEIMGIEQSGVQKGDPTRSESSGKVTLEIKPAPPQTTGKVVLDIKPRQKKEQ